MKPPLPIDLLYAHGLLICKSFEQWTGKELITSYSILCPTNLVSQLYNADFVLVSHGTESDPIFNFANAKAQELWEMNWDEFTQLPSRLSAETMDREEREKIIKEGQKKGFVVIDKGIRITKSGKKFLIKNTLLWNLVNDQGEYCGQAATYTKWEFLEID